VIIDPIDLKLIRQLEMQGSVALGEFVSKFHIDTEQVLLRIKNFEDAGFITGYGLKIFIPAVLGGRWWRGCIFAESAVPVEPEKTIPYLEEIINNQAYPMGVAPNLSLLFYTQDLKNSYQVAQKLPGIKYCEFYKAGEYNVNVPRILLKNDWAAIASLYKGRLTYRRIHGILNEPETEHDVRLAHLIWHRKNRSGVVSLYPNFNWSVINNFAHVHFAVNTKMRIKDLRKYLTTLGLAGNVTARYKKRYLQLEFDVWGFSEYQNIVNALNLPRRMTLEGCSIAYQNKIYDAWLKRFISEEKS
jgi:DNA-binding Lrp family transcriptional regulator